MPKRNYKKIDKKIRITTPSRSIKDDLINAANFEFYGCNFTSESRKLLKFYNLLIKYNITIREFAGMLLYVMKLSGDSILDGHTRNKLTSLGYLKRLGNNDYILGYKGKLLIEEVMLVMSED